MFRGRGAKLRMFVPIMALRLLLRLVWERFMLLRPTRPLQASVLQQPVAFFLLLGIVGEGGGEPPLGFFEGHALPCGVIGGLVAPDRGYPEVARLRVREVEAAHRRPGAHGAALR